MSASCQYRSDRLQDPLNGRVAKRYANDNRRQGSTVPRQHPEYDPPVTDDAGSDNSVPFVVRDDEGYRRHYRDHMYPEQFPRYPGAGEFRHHERIHEPPPIQPYHDIRNSNRFGPRPQNYGYPSQGPESGGISPGRVPSTGPISRHPGERMRTPRFSPHGQSDAPIGTPASDLQSSHRLHEVQSDEMNDHENRSQDPMHEDFDPVRNVPSDVRDRDTIHPRAPDYENGPEDPEVLPPASAVHDLGLTDLGPVPRDSIPQDQRSEITIDGEHVVLSISDSFERPPSIEPDDLPLREMGLGPNLSYQRSQRSMTPHSRPAYGSSYHSSSGSRRASHPDQYRHNYSSSPTGYSDDSTLLGESEYYENNWPQQAPPRGREFDYIDYSSGYEYTSHTTATFYLVPEGINCVFVDDYGNEISRIGDPSGHRRYSSHHCRPPVIINDELGREIYRMGDWGSDHFRRGGRGNKCTRDHTRPLSIYRHEYVRRKDHRDRYGQSYGRITRCTQIPRGAKIVIIDYDGHQVHLT